MRTRTAAIPGAPERPPGDAAGRVPWRHAATGDTTSEPGGELISGLETTLKTYLPEKQVAKVRKAYQFSASAHAGQKRMSGEPYISHPLHVAQTMAQLHFDTTTIISGILHDVLEDTHVTKHQLTRKFGREVSGIVDGVSKIDHLHIETREVKQAGNFQKMILAMSKDLRVILVKLIDRLHNMRTLHHLPPAKQKRVAKETLEIYTPIAQRLGMDRVRREFEELGFKALYPIRHRVLLKAVEKSGGRHRKLMQSVQSNVRRRLKSADITHEIASRRKNTYSIYRKMCRKHLSFSEVFDVFALRLTVDKVDNCYRALGLVHNLYKPVPGRFKDYIAIPKANGYQSLHTVLFGPQGIPIEIQIRTHEMNNVAEQGIAAHSLYKTDDTGSSASGHSRVREWTTRLVEMRKHAGNATDFLDNVKLDLFPDEVYVFTPQGEIMSLPRGATALDFAFSVHTDLGLSCSRVLVNKRLSPLSTELENGQTVEIITDKSAHPTPLWLGFAVTGKARAAIRGYLKNTGEKSAIKLGRRLLKGALENLGSDPGKISPQQWSRILQQLRLKKRENLLKEIGLGNQMSPLIARRLIDPESTGTAAADKPIAITGTEGVVVSYAKCCHPIPGDSIIGLLNPGKGLVVHRDSCRNVTGSIARDDKSILLQWAEKETPGAEYSAAIRAVTQHRRGMLAVIADKIAQTGSNIENLSLEERPGAMALLTFTISVRNRDHLAEVMRKIHGVSKDVRVSRAK